MILAGDVGGTKATIGLFEVEGDQLAQRQTRTFPSARYPGLDTLVQEFLGGVQKPSIRAACFGVPGAVVNGASQITNLPWQLTERSLAASIGAPAVKLLNDLEASAYGMLHLAANELVPLNPGSGPERHANMVVIAAGTGLGEGILFWDGQRHHPMASEGGHADFAPRNDEEMDLLRYLRERFGGHVSYERVLSGPGLFNVYSFLREHGPEREPPGFAQRIAAAADPAPLVTQSGLSGENELAAHALALFASIYGAEAGNLALKCLAVGGVYVAGGIAPRILAVLKTGGFMQAFCAKGRFHDLLASLPVRVALDLQAPLIGAAYFARDHFQ
jgi:glucokinase